MSLSAQTRPGLVRRLARRAREWARKRDTVAALDSCGPSDTERIARDLGVGGTELRVLAGKWPDSSDLLSRRMRQNELDAAELVRVEPQVVRDLERVCTLCASRRQCDRDFANERPNPAWEKYCPNAMTLRALIAERRRIAKTKAT